MKYKFQITGPFLLQEINNDDPKYLKLLFNDGHERKMSKGGRWPPEYAQNLYEKANHLRDKLVYIKTSKTTDDWATTKWLCDVHPKEVAEKRLELAQLFRPDIQDVPKESEDKYILVSATNGKTYYANAELVVDSFSTVEDFLDFSQNFEKDFVSAWVAKNTRTKGLPLGVKRVRISGFGEKSKRNGFRVIVAEMKTKDTSEAFKFFHILRVDDKLEREDYLSDAEIKEVKLLKKSLEDKYPATQISWLEDDLDE